MPIDLPDDSTLWPTPTLAPGAVMHGPVAVVTCLQPGGAALISGDLPSAVDALAPGAPMLGLLDQTPGEGAFALRIARDRALLVTDEPLEAAPGWKGSWALSPADDLYLCLRIEGEGIAEVQSACMSAPEGSPSAAAPFGECLCLIARTGAALDVRVPAPEAAALWLRLSWLIAA